MIFVRSLAFTVYFYLWSTLSALAMVPTLLGPRRWLSACLKVWGQGVIFGLAVFCDIRMEVRGRQFIPHGAALVAPKHQCMFDVFAQYVILPDCCFVMKKELMAIPFVGWFASKMGMIVVDRSGGSATLRKMVREALERFAEGRRVIIFPEGTRGPPGVPGDYKPGTAALYRELGVACVPVATNSGIHWPAHGFLRRPGVIVFEFLEPIPAGLKRAAFMTQLTERVEAASMALLDEGI